MSVYHKAGQKGQKFFMDKDTARREVRREWRRVIVKYTQPAKKKVNGKETYICPFCGHGKNGDGIKDNPKSKDGYGIKCFGACEFSGDIIDFIRQATGADYNTALKTAAADLGITIDEPPQRPNQYNLHNLVLNDNTWKNDTPKPPAAQKAQNAPKTDDSGADDKTPALDVKSPQKGAQTATGADNEDATDEIADYTAYYEQCSGKLSDPAAISYLQARGISQETAAAYNLGYDPAWISPTVVKNQRAKGRDWTPAPTARLILPVTKNHYVARAIDPKIEDYKKMNETGGGNVGIFNAGAVYGDQEAVFVTEGIFDALSIIECGAAAVALNSTSNANLFIEQLEKKPTGATLVLCLDSDASGKKAAATIREGLFRLDIPYITGDINGEYKDANEALTGNRAAFERAIADALDRAKNGEPLPGLLTLQNAIAEFENANDKYLQISSFKNFSETAKIKVHDSVVLAADTGAGKSSLAINFLNGLKEEYPCIYINLEMDNITILRRLVAIQSGLLLDQIEDYKNDEKTAKAVNISLSEIVKSKPLQIVKGCYTVEEIEELIAQSTKGREEPTVVFIDHSLLVNTKKKTTGRYERFTEVSEELRKITLKYNIILFVLLQQNREGKKDEEKPPTNSSLKESGSWENDATHIVFLWWDPIEKKKKLLLTKNRGGSAGEFPLFYLYSTQLYIEDTDNGEFVQTNNKKPPTAKQSRREKQRAKLTSAYREAYINTLGKPTLQAIAEAADVTTSTVKTWLKEYGGFTVDGKQIDPAGIDAVVEKQEFIKLTPTDNTPFDGNEQTTQTAGTEQDGKRRIF